jgi:Glyoxalase-like domain
VNTQLDHLVIAAATLEQGADWCEALLGVRPLAGGRHAAMGTHNLVMKLDAPGTAHRYLEIIAIDPQAEAPGRPRWFGLDDSALQADLAQRGPRLINAVARSTMLDMHRWGLIQIGIQPGEPFAMSRPSAQADLAWEILLKPDGRLLYGGALPSLIQWKGPHPAQALPDSGVVLQRLQAQGLPPRVGDVLRTQGMVFEPAASPAPRLMATLRGPAGEVVLGSD